MERIGEPDRANQFDGMPAAPITGAISATGRSAIHKMLMPDILSIQTTSHRATTATKM
jgi:hypothetical protein